MDFPKTKEEKSVSESLEWLDFVKEMVGELDMGAWITLKTEKLDLAIADI